MSYIYNNNEACANCSNNPAVNPFASGVCHCVMPYISTIPNTETVTTVSDTTEWKYIKHDFKNSDSVFIPSVWST